MIGFSQELQSFEKDSTEGLETLNLSKTEIYEIVSADYILPPCTAKGITREYLLKVKNGEVFRLLNTDYKKFEYPLNKAQMRKIGTVNNALLVKKLNLLLKLKGQNDLGYTEFNLPEQVWLYKIARYIDPTNLLEFFESPAMPENPLTESSSPISQIHYGRRFASEWLFRLPSAQRNKKLWDTFETLAEKYRVLISTKVNVDILQYELEETMKKVAIQQMELHDMVGKAAITYTQLEDPKITPELVISGAAELTEAMRKQLTTNSQL